MTDLTIADLRDIAGRVRAGSDIDAEASLYSLPQLIAALRLTRGELIALLELWTPEQLRFRPPEVAGAGGDDDRWSATEAASHLVATQNWYLLNLDRMLGRRRQYEPMPRGLGDHADPDVPKPDLIARLQDATERLVMYLEAVPPDTDLAARRNSIFFGELSIRGWALLAIIHDLDHLAQIERVESLPAFPR
jgi:DinB superfamily